MYCLIFDVVIAAVVASAALHSPFGQVHISAFYQIKFITLPFIASQCSAINISYSNSNSQSIGWVSLFLFGWMKHANKSKKNRHDSITFCIDFIVLYCFNCVYNKFSNHIACTHNIQIKYFVCDKQSKCRLCAVTMKLFQMEFALQPLITSLASVAVTIYTHCSYWLNVINKQLIGLIWICFRSVANLDWVLSLSPSLFLPLCCVD